METLVTWRADQGTAEARQRTRHETIGALDGFAQQPQGSLTRWIALRGGTIFSWSYSCVRRSREVEGLVCGRESESLYQKYSRLHLSHLIFDLYQIRSYTRSRRS